MDPLQYVRASPQSIPDEHLNPSSEVVRLVHAPAGETIGEGYTCTVHLPSSLPPEDVGMVNLAGQRPSSHSSTAASARASITLGSFALRVTKKGHRRMSIGTSTGAVDFQRSRSFPPYWPGTRIRGGS